MSFQREPFTQSSRKARSSHQSEPPRTTYANSDQHQHDYNNQFDYIYTHKARSLHYFKTNSMNISYNYSNFTLRINYDT